MAAPTARSNSGASNFKYLLEGEEEKMLVAFDEAADSSAELLAVEILEGLAVGRVRGQASSR